MERNLVHTVQGDVDKTRNTPFHHHRTAHQVPHQAADGTEAGQRHQRAVIFIHVGFERLAFALGEDVFQRSRRHLVRRLRARRHESAARQRAGGAVADGVNIVVQRGLQRLFDHQLINAVGLQPANLFHEVWRFNTGRPHHQIGFDEFAPFGIQTVGCCAGDHGLRQYAHAKLAQLLMRRCGDARWQRRQNTLAGFHQRDVERAAVETFIAVAVQLFHCVIQFCRQLDAGRAAADNGDIDFLQLPFAGREAQEQVEHLIVETTRLMRVVEEDAVIFHAWRAEIVRGAAQRHHQTVIRQFALRYQQPTLRVADLSQFNGFSVAINLRQRTQLELETVVARMRQIAERINTFIHRTGRHFMQQRFPQMAVVTIDQDDLRLFFAAEFMAELRCQLQPSGTATDDDDFFHACSQ
ncbi:hypothetical protein COLO4_01279 [Corchorus olitorius]|uniref:Uncharacterized protein n=1 Tax=Corchorus olitorius TaxID=93759 RepID=A0A1R3L2N4_9ROSI|nr:hypothetical protein COLO4_01279 [Corchorus olitorius]